MIEIASEKPADQYADREREKNQQRTRQGYAPEEKCHLKVVVRGEPISRSDEIVDRLMGVEE